VTRIIAGEFGGRRLAAPRDRRIRPTADQVREPGWAFSGPPAGRCWISLRDRALGLEALSRGRPPPIVEKVRRAGASRNIETLTLRAVAG
jgi:16S rRNA G966 N2-methylase RsmD